MILFAVIVAVANALATVLLVRDIRRLERRHDALLRSTQRFAVASRRVHDRLAYYEHRADGLKGLRTAYDKRLAKKIAQDNDAPDAAPEGTAQAERLVG